jgi:hypothetical protein
VNVDVNVSVMAAGLSCLYPEPKINAFFCPCMVKYKVRCSRTNKSLIVVVRRLDDILSYPILSKVQNIAIIFEKAIVIL